MKALVYAGKEKMEIRDVPKPAIGPDDISMKVRSVGICGTDLHIYRGGLDIPKGTIPGHEFSGVVAETGKNVTSVKKGDRIVAEHVASCGKCDYCKTGKPNLCCNSKVIGLQLPGALAEYIRIPANLVYPFPNSMTFDEAALIEPLSIAFYAVREAGFLLDKRVAVLGQGPIGLLLDQVLVAAGALVTGIDVRPNTLAFAKKMGWVHHTINSKQQNLKARMKEINSASGFDMVFEAVGIEKTAELAFDITRRDGNVYLLGVFSAPATINMMNIIKKELNVHGSWTCAFSFPESIDLVARKKVDLKSLITHTYQFSNAVMAFKEANCYSQNRVKTIIKL